jgi:hypothetical protein
MYCKDNVMDFINALLGNGCVNMFQHTTIGAVSVDECYSLLLGSSQHANELGGW